MATTCTPDATPRSTLTQMLVLLRDGDLNALADLYAEDGVHELPFAPAPAPRHIEGREQVRTYFTDVLSGVPLEFHAFEEVAVHDTADPEVIVAEYDAHGVALTSGRSFTVRNIWVLRIVDGRIATWRDYWNPMEIMNLQGLLPDVAASTAGDRKSRPARISSHTPIVCDTRSSSGRRPPGPSVQ